VEPDAAARPDGIPGSVLTGPFAVGQYAAALRDRLRGFARVQVFGEVVGFKAGRAKVWFELRDATGALPCSMWRRDFDALGLGALEDGAQVVAAGGCDYYPGSRT
jgi:exodeoxyribonuclease VII large subunit